MRRSMPMQPIPNKIKPNMTPAESVRLDVIERSKNIRIGNVTRFAFFEPFFTRYDLQKIKKAEEKRQRKAAKRMREQTKA